jgi:hypothetical protein
MSTGRQIRTTTAVNRGVVGLWIDENRLAAREAVFI